MIISVIVTTRNQRTTICRALDSILGQRCRASLEVIIGDDASTDGTTALCRRYRDAHPDTVRLIEHSTRQGVTANYYACMDAATGQYIADLAGDDEWATADKLQRELEAIEADPTLAIVHTDYDRRDAATGRLTHVAFPYTTTPTGGPDLATEVLAQGPRPVIHLCTALYRRDAAMSCRQKHPQFFMPQWPCEDLQLATLIGYEGRALHLPVTTLHYTVGRQSISNGTDDRRQYAFKLQCLQLAVELRRHLALDSDTARRRKLDTAFAKHLHDLVMHAFRLHDPDLRRDALSHAQEWHITPHTLTRLALAATATTPTWHAALALRRLFVNIKRLRD